LNDVSELKQLFLGVLLLFYVSFVYFDYPVETVRTGTMSSSGEVVVVLIGLMLQELLSHMGGSAITPQDIIRRVTAQGNAFGIRLGEVGMMYFAALFGIVLCCAVLFHLVRWYLIVFSLCYSSKI
jgi:hypothetical protein